jgi:hypothetical protein
LDRHAGGARPVLFLSLEGFVLRRGDKVLDAEELQSGFTAAVARCGGMRAE